MNKEFAPSNPNTQAPAPADPNEVTWDTLGDHVPWPTENQDEQERPLSINTDDISTISVSPDNSNKLGPNREDRRTDIHDATGHAQRGPDFFFGYNKAGRTFENGDYLSTEDLTRAIDAQLAATGDGAKIVRHEPAPAEYSDGAAAMQAIFAQAIDGHSSIELTPNSNMPDRNAHESRLRDAETGEVFRSSNILLGAEIQLPDGDYIKAEAFNAAIADYLIAPNSTVPPAGGETTQTPRQPETSNPRPESEPQKSRFQRVLKHVKVQVLPLIMVGALLAGTTVAPEATADSDPSANANYDVQATHIMTDEELQANYANDLLANLHTGDTYNTPAGLDYHESSDYAIGGANANDTFGNPEGLRPAGEHTAEYFSILGPDGNIIDVHYEQGTSLGDAVQQASAETGIPVDQLHPMIHFGNEVSGWSSAEGITQQQVQQTAASERITTDTEQHSGTVENFQGTITFTNDKGEQVSFNAYDDNGNLHQPGDLVTGSDGITYRVNNIDINQIQHN